MIIKEKLENQEKFNEIEKVIANYLLEKQETFEAVSIRHMAEELYISTGTIVRFCKKLGFERFNEMKQSYIEEINYLNSHFTQINPNFPFDYQDDAYIVSQKIKQLFQETLEDTSSLIDKDQLKKVIQLLHQSENIYIVASGYAEYLGDIFRFRMSPLPKNVFLSENFVDMYYKACNANKKDCFLFVSYSGETSPLLKIATKVKSRKIPIISITSLGENSLSKLSDKVLYLSTREKLHHNLGNFSSVMSMYYLLEVIYANVFNQAYFDNFKRKKQFSIEYELNKHISNQILKDE